MPLSQDFLPLFDKFVTNYKQNGAPSRIAWAREQNHSDICTYLDQILTLISANHDSFHDSSIIEYITIPIILSANTNRYLLDCWIKFVIDYNSITKIYTPINAMGSSSFIHIQIGVEANPSERMMRELQSALVSTQQAQKFSTQAYSSELELLKQQLADSNRENLQLKAENQALKKKVHNEQLFESLEPQIEAAQEQLALFASLLHTLKGIAGGKKTSSSSALLSTLPPVDQVANTSVKVNPAPFASTSTTSGEASDISSSATHVSPYEPMISSTLPPKAPASLKVNPAPIASTSSSSGEASDIGSSSTHVSLHKPEISPVPATRPPKVPAPPKASPATSPPPDSVFKGKGFFDELSLAVAKRKANSENSATATTTTGKKKT